MASEVTDPAWELLTRLIHASRFNPIFEEPVLDLLHHASCPAFVVRGFSVPGRFDSTVVAVVQGENETVLARLKETTEHYGHAERKVSSHFRMGSLARLCEHTCRFLDRHGFCEAPVDIGEMALDGQSALIGARIGDQVHHVHFWDFYDAPREHKWLKHFIRYWLLASRWRFRFAGWLDRWFARSD